MNTSIPEPQRTPYPFNDTAAGYATGLRFVPVRDLIAFTDTAREGRAVARMLAEYEGDCWNAVLAADDLGDAFAVACLIADRTATEIRVLAQKRRALDRFLQTNPGHRHTPTWPEPDPRRRDRVAAVKAALPMETFVRDHLLIDLTRSGDCWKGRCPFPGHDDKSPSFYVYPDGNAWCFGCNRGGDLLRVAATALNTTDFRDTLARLEALTGIGGTR